MLMCIKSYLSKGSIPVFEMYFSIDLICNLIVGDLFLRKSKMLI